MSDSEMSPASKTSDVHRLVMRQNSLFAGTTIPCKYCGKWLQLSVDDIDSGKSRIRIFGDDGKPIKGDAGLVGRMLLD